MLNIDQAFVQVFNHFGKTSAASEIVKTLLDDTDTLKSKFIYFIDIFL